MNESLKSGFPIWGWGVFAGTVLVILLADLFAHRDGRAKTNKSALIWISIWVGAGLLFNVFVWIVFSAQPAQEYLAAYLIEESLSVDNLFVFLMIFEMLEIPGDYQYRVLLWGIFGAAIFRGLFIFIGVTALERWNWISYVLGATLFFAAFRVLRKGMKEQQQSRPVDWLKKRLPVTDDLKGHRFLTHQKGRYVATPLLIALVGIELTDIFFAIDSVPATFSVSRMPFIIYSSNMFAVLGLRSFYVVLAKTLTQFRYLHYGLAGVLGLAGFKLITDQWVTLPPLLSVALIAVIIGASVGASLHARKKEQGYNQKDS